MRGWPSSQHYWIVWGLVANLPAKTRIIDCNIPPPSPSCGSPTSLGLSCLNTDRGFAISVKLASIPHGLAGHGIVLVFTVMASISCLFSHCWPCPVTVNCSLLPLEALRYSLDGDHAAGQIMPPLLLPSLVSLDVYCRSPRKRLIGSTPFG